ncbi:thioester domain-containing protein [Embleya hyalina]|uniref:TQXA domain-containing protein n=1 Tax=Embleya hyalina TaxID=516124 RepID=A0A401YQW3_9ACTN|nr:thioester domain-containing protein [Embleya hyalina]GCD96945.1 TQXA domain-containing protein [Embleya hyalina]
MFRVPGRSVARLSAWTAAIGVTGAIGFAGTARADGVSGTLEGFGADQTTLVSVKGPDPRMNRTLPMGYMNLRLDGGEVIKVYCVDLLHDVTDRYQESSWEGTWLADKDVPAVDKAKLKWILGNSFPTKTLQQLKDASGIAGLDAGEAGGATQAAIWHFSDGAEIDNAKEKNEDVKKLYDYLIRTAKPDDGSEPKISLTITPERLTGSRADKPGIGPFTVTTSATGKAISAAPTGTSGTRLVDKDGATVTGRLGDGDRVWIAPPEGTEAGEATLEVSGKASVEAGRVFKGLKPGQLVIAVGQRDIKVEDSARAGWTAKQTPPTPGGTTGDTAIPPTPPTPAKGPELAETGGSGVDTPAVLAGGAVLVGLGAVLTHRAVRRRATKTPAS